MKFTARLAGLIIWPILPICPVSSYLVKSRQKSRQAQLAFIGVGVMGQAIAMAPPRPENRELPGYVGRHQHRGQRKPGRKLGYNMSA